MKPATIHQVAVDLIEADDFFRLYATCVRANLALEEVRVRQAGKITEART
jgi:hypothetical protein